MILKRFNNTVLKRYPRMTPADAITWSKFLNLHGDEYQKFDYDLRVGKGVTVELPVPEKYKEDFQQLTQKRIDCVGYNNNVVTIFEVKGRAGLSALGQLKAYKSLFLQSYPGYSVSALVLVCSFATDEELDLYMDNGIKVYVFS